MNDDTIFECRPSITIDDSALDLVVGDGVVGVGVVHIIGEDIGAKVTGKLDKNSRASS